MTNSLMKFSETLQSDKRYIVAFYNTHMEGWRFGCGLNASNSLYNLDAKLYRESWTKTIELIPGSNLRPSVHDNFKSLLTNAILLLTDQVVIYEVSNSEHKLDIVAFLTSHQAIKNWMTQNVS